MRKLLVVTVICGVVLGATNADPSIGFTAGFTYVFTAFTLP